MIRSLVKRGLYKIIRSHGPKIKYRITHCPNCEKPQYKRHSSNIKKDKKNKN